MMLQLLRKRKELTFERSYAAAPLVAVWMRGGDLGYKQQLHDLEAYLATDGHVGP